MIFKKKEKTTSKTVQKTTPKKKKKIKRLRLSRRARRWLLKHKVLYVLVNILLFPFEVFYVVADFIINFFNLILNVLLILFIGALIAGSIIFAKVLPMYQEASEVAYEKLSNLSEENFYMLSNTVIYDKNGDKIGEIDAGDYQYVEIDDISDYIQKGYIAVEDKQFMEHCGINLRSLTRAAIAMVKNNGEVTQGGSTITQQVIKNNLLTQDQTYSRKITEILIAPTLEQKFGKPKIMEFYCNSNYYGNQCYGVEAACQFYFGKSAKDVSIAEAAMLCGISNSPNNYNPIASMEKAKQKQKQVLGEMLEENYISKSEYDKALAEEIKVVGVSKTYETEDFMTSYAIYCTALELLKKDGFEFKYTFTSSEEEKAYNLIFEEAYNEKASLIRMGGYKIYTSFDPVLQKQLQESVSTTLEDFTDIDEETEKLALQSAAVCIDNDSQLVVAMVGGRDEKDQFNRAFLSTRQPGSTIKPLLDYGPAINEGIINGSSVYEDKQVFWNDDDVDSYSPTNSGGGYRGSVTIREALARSLNTIAFQLFKQLGFETALSYLDKMQFSSISYVDQSAPSISLGGFTYGVTVEDMCRGYATIANGGKFSTKTCLVKIEHEQDGVIYEEPKKSEEVEVFTADTAFMLQDIMQGTINEEYGTGHSAYNANQVYAGKTGTTNSMKDAWFCGFSPYYTTAVWIGYDTPQEMSGMYGGTYPLKIWSNFMDEIHTDLPFKNFDLPETIELKLVGSSTQVITTTNEEDEEVEEVVNLPETADIAKFDLTKRIYSQRPSGYEFIGQLNSENTEKWIVDYELEQTKYDAEKAVEEFEAYTITSVEDALGFDTLYNDTLAIIDKIPDEYVQSEYKIRASNRYELLTQEAMTDWATAIEEYNNAESERIEQQNQIDAEDAENSALESLHSTRISKMEWFIEKLNNRSYYTDITKLLVTNGQSQLAKCEGYSEYSDLKERFESAKSKVESLPEKPEEPVIPETDEDSHDINPNDYTDPVNDDD